MPKRVITPGLIEKVRKLVKLGHNGRDIVVELGISASVVSVIRNTYCTDIYHHSKKTDDEFRTCSMCGITKPITEYHRNKDKRQSRCKECCAKVNREHNKTKLTTGKINKIYKKKKNPDTEITVYHRYLKIYKYNNWYWADIKTPLAEPIILSEPCDNIVTCIRNIFTFFFFKVSQPYKKKVLEHILNLIDLFEDEYEKTCIELKESNDRIDLENLKPIYLDITDYFKD
jgi:hypothetical protein